MEPRLERKGEKSSFEFISSTKIRMMEFLLNINDETLAKYMKLDAQLSGIPLTDEKGIEVDMKALNRMVQLAVKRNVFAKSILRDAWVNTRVKCFYFLKLGRVNLERLNLQKYMECLEEVEREIDNRVRTHIDEETHVFQILLSIEKLKQYLRKHDIDAIVFSYQHMRELLVKIKGCEFGIFLNFRVDAAIGYAAKLVQDDLIVQQRMNSANKQYQKLSGEKLQCHFCTPDDAFINMICSLQLCKVLHRHDQTLLAKKQAYRIYTELLNPQYIIKAKANLIVEVEKFIRSCEKYLSGKKSMPSLLSQEKNMEGDMSVPANNMHQFSQLGNQNPQEDEAEVHPQIVQEDAIIIKHIPLYETPRNLSTYINNMRTKSGNYFNQSTSQTRALNQKNVLIQRNKEVMEKGDEEVGKQQSQNEITQSANDNSGNQYQKLLKDQRNYTFMNEENDIKNKILQQKCVAERELFDMSNGQSIEEVMEYKHKTQQQTAINENIDSMEQNTQIQSGGQGQFDADERTSGPSKNKLLVRSIIYNKEGKVCQASTINQIESNLGLIQTRRTHLKHKSEEYINVNSLQTDTPPLKDYFQFTSSKNDSKSFHRKRCSVSKQSLEQMNGGEQHVSQKKEDIVAKPFHLNPHFNAKVNRLVNLEYFQTQPSSGSKSINSFIRFQAAQLRSPSDKAPQEQLKVQISNKSRQTSQIGSKCCRLLSDSDSKTAQNQPQNSQNLTYNDPNEHYNLDNAIYNQQKITFCQQNNVSEEKNQQNQSYIKQGDMQNQQETLVQPMRAEIRDQTDGNNQDQATLEMPDSIAINSSTRRQHPSSASTFPSLQTQRNDQLTSLSKNERVLSINLRNILTYDLPSASQLSNKSKKPLIPYINLLESPVSKEVNEIFGSKNISLQFLTQRPMSMKAHKSKPLTSGKTSEIQRGQNNFLNPTIRNNCHSQANFEDPSQQSPLKQEKSNHNKQRCLHFHSNRQVSPKESTDLKSKAQSSRDLVDPRSSESIVCMLSEQNEMIGQCSNKKENSNLPNKLISNSCVDTQNIPNVSESEPKKQGEMGNEWLRENEKRNIQEQLQQNQLQLIPNEYLNRFTHIDSTLLYSINKASLANQFETIVKRNNYKFDFATLKQNYPLLDTSSAYSKTIAEFAHLEKKNSDTSLQQNDRSQQLSSGLAIKKANSRFSDHNKFESNEKKSQSKNEFQISRHMLSLPNQINIQQIPFSQRDKIYQLNLPKAKFSSSKLPQNINEEQIIQSLGSKDLHYDSKPTQKYRSESIYKKEENIRIQLNQARIDLNTPLKSLISKQNTLFSLHSPRSEDETHKASSRGISSFRQITNNYSSPQWILIISFERSTVNSEKQVGSHNLIVQEEPDKERQNVLQRQHKISSADEEAQEESIQQSQPVHMIVPQPPMIESQQKDIFKTLAFVMTRKKKWFNVHSKQKERNGSEDLQSYDEMSHKLQELDLKQPVFSFSTYRMGRFQSWKVRYVEYSEEHKCFQINFMSLDNLFYKMFVPVKEEQQQFLQESVQFVTIWPFVLKYLLDYLNSKKIKLEFCEEEEGQVEEEKEKEGEKETEKEKEQEKEDDSQTKKITKKNKKRKKKNKLQFQDFGLRKYFLDQAIHSEALHIANEIYQFKNAQQNDQTNAQVSKPSLKDILSNRSFKISTPAIDEKETINHMLSFHKTQFNFFLGLNRKNAYFPTLRDAFAAAKIKKTFEILLYRYMYDQLRPTGKKLILKNDTSTQKYKTISQKILQLQKFLDRNDHSDHPNIGNGVDVILSHKFGTGLLRKIVQKDVMKMPGKQDLQIVKIWKLRFRGTPCHVCSFIKKASEGTYYLVSLSLAHRKSQKDLVSSLLGKPSGKEQLNDQFDKIIMVQLLYRPQQGSAEDSFFKDRNLKQTSQMESQIGDASSMFGTTAGRRDSRKSQFHVKQQEPQKQLPKFANKKVFHNDDFKEILAAYDINLIIKGIVYHQKIPKLFKQFCIKNIKKRIVITNELLFLKRDRADLIRRKVNQPPEILVPTILPNEKDLLERDYANKTTPFEQGFNAAYEKSEFTQLKLAPKHQNEQKDSELSDNNDDSVIDWLPPSYGIKEVDEELDRIDKFEKPQTYFSKDLHFKCPSQMKTNPKTIHVRYSVNSIVYSLSVSLHNQLDPNVSESHLDISIYSSSIRLRKTFSTSKQKALDMFAIFAKRMPTNDVSWPTASVVRKRLIDDFKTDIQRISRRRTIGEITARNETAIINLSGLPSFETIIVILLKNTQQMESQRSFKKYSTVDTINAYGKIEIKLFKQVLATLTIFYSPSEEMLFALELQDLASKSKLYRMAFNDHDLADLFGLKLFPDDSPDIIIRILRRICHHITFEQQNVYRIPFLQFRKEDYRSGLKLRARNVTERLSKEEMSDNYTKFKNNIARFSFEKENTNSTKKRRMIEVLRKQSRIIFHRPFVCRKEYLILTIQKSLNFSEFWTAQIYSPKTGRKLMGYIQAKDFEDIQFQDMSKSIALLNIYGKGIPYKTYKDFLTDLNASDASNETSIRRQKVNLMRVEVEKFSHQIADNIIEKDNSIEIGDASSNKLSSDSQDSDYEDAEENTKRDEYQENQRRANDKRKGMEVDLECNAYYDEENESQIKNVISDKFLEITSQISRTYKQANALFRSQSHLSRFVEMIVWEELSNRMELQHKGSKHVMKLGEIGIPMEEFISSNQIRTDKGQDTFVEYYIGKEHEKKSEPFVTRNYEEISYPATLGYFLILRFYYIGQVGMMHRRINLRELMNLFIADGYYKYQTNYMHSHLQRQDLVQLCDFVSIKFGMGNYGSVLSHNQFQFRRTALDNYSRKTLQTLLRVQETQEAEDTITETFILGSKPYKIARVHIKLTKRVIVFVLYTPTNSATLKKTYPISKLHHIIPFIELYLQAKLFRPIAQYLLNNLLQQLKSSSTFL